MKNEDLDGVFCEVQTCLQGKVERYHSCIYTLIYTFILAVPKSAAFCSNSTLTDVPISLRCFSNAFGIVPSAPTTTGTTFNSSLVVHSVVLGQPHQGASAAPNVPKSTSKPGRFFYLFIHLFIYLFIYLPS